MGAPWARRFRFSALAVAVAAAVAPVAVGDAAVLTVVIPPFPTRTVTYAQCASFTFNGTTLTCVPVTAPPPPPPDPEQPPTTPGTPFAGCPGDALMIDAPWGSTAINTFDYGYFGPNILSVRVTVPANATGTNTRSSSWVEYGTAPFVREAVLSTAACDFSNTNALRNGFGQPMRSAPNAVSFAFQYTLGPAGRFATRLTPGQTYYVNVRNRFSDGSLSCPLTSCAMRGGFPQ